MAAARCTRCDATDDVRLCGLCDTCIATRTIDELEASGIDPAHLDPAVKVRLAELLGLTDPLESTPAA